MNVQLQWNRNSEQDVTGYNAYRGTQAGGPYTKINTALIPQPGSGITPSFTDAGAPNQQVFYVVRAVNPAGESANSNEATAKPLQVPSAPTGLTASSSIAVTLAVDANPVAMAAGAIPLGLDYNLPKITPPAPHLLSIRVSEVQR